MAKRDNAREDGIADLSVEELRARLVAAERLCVVFGWCRSRREESPRDAMAYEAWSLWYGLVGSDLGGPAHNRLIDDAVRFVERR